ncbi:MAG: 4Fe-4S ferredoxin [Actinobacteria bacterium HGW-Actinobacteria-1]|nr:MAG: 4Fe-4S ferredoxin [Actinobacteria bacterium HGW-Actinobacteria-1]
MRSKMKASMITRAGALLERAGLKNAIAEGDLVAVKLHFGEQGNTGFVNPVFVREVVRRVKGMGGRPFLTDANTLYRGQRANAVDHLECALHNGFSYATIEAPLVIADGLDGRDAVDVPVSGRHFESVRIGSAAVYADAMIAVTHVKGHEATGFGGAIKNVGMGLGCRSAKQRMHADFKPEVTAEKCTACARCVKWCPVGAITIGPDRVARVDYEVCYGCGECVAACPFAAIATQWKTDANMLQEKIVEHVAGAVTGKEGKTLYLSFVTAVSPDCDCWNFSDAPIVPDIGVLASEDIVAIDQAAYDLVTAAVGVPGSRGEGMDSGDDKFTAITGVDGTRAMAYAEELGLGSREYELITVE